MINLNHEPLGPNRGFPASCRFSSLRQLNHDFWLEAIECPDTILETAGHKVSLQMLRYCAYHMPHVAYDVRHKLCPKRRAVVLGYMIEMAGLAFNDDEVKTFVDELTDSMLAHRSIWNANFRNDWDKLWNYIRLYLGIRIGSGDVSQEVRLPACPSIPRAVLRHSVPTPNRSSCSNTLCQERPNKDEIEAFGTAWCGPEIYEIQKTHLVARYDPADGEEGQVVEIFCTAKPARFYTIRVLELPIRTGGIRPAYELGTGSSMAMLAAKIGEAIAHGMLGLNSR